MSFIDKAKNAAEDAVGKVKEAVGDATGNDSLEPTARPTRPKPASRTPARRPRTSATT